MLVDVAWTGGLSEARRVAELAGTYHLPFAPHDCTGPVTALANLHLALPMPNCIAVEVVRGFLDGYYREVLDARSSSATARPPCRPARASAPPCSPTSPTAHGDVRSVR